MKQFKVIKSVLIITIIAHLNLCVKAQSWDWGLMSGANQGSILDIGEASNCNLLAVGNFASTLQIGEEVLNSQGANDIFISKFDTNGQLFLLKQVVGFGDDYGTSISVSDYGLY